MSHPGEYWICYAPIIRIQMFILLEMICFHFSDCIMTHVFVSLASVITTYDCERVLILKEMSDKQHHWHSQLLLWVDLVLWRKSYERHQFITLYCGQCQLIRFISHLQSPISSSLSNSTIQVWPGWIRNLQRIYAPDRKLGLFVRSLTCDTMPRWVYEWG